MHLAHLRLRDFRNYRRLDADFFPGFHLLLGENAQGKTNLLEAIYLLATLRSFRGVGNAQLVRHGQKGFFAGGQLVGQGTHEVRFYWSSAERKLTLDSQPVRRLADYFGVLRAVVFCAEDLQLVKGPAARRRRYLDLLLAHSQAAYLPLLQRYHQALRSRNALLKQKVLDAVALDSFTHELVATGNELIRLRRELMPRLSPHARQAYRRIAHEAEELILEYKPSVKHDFAVELAQARDRELAYRVTWLGPHRDDLRLLLDDQPAAQFASEGQQRTLAIALKMAQADYLTHLHGAPPILLLDDVMGELDARRRSGLLPLLEQSHQASGQVFLTGTEERWPQELARDLHRWTVHAGTLRPLE